MIKIGLGESVMHTYAETEAKNFEAMDVMEKKYGVTIHRWPDEVLKLMEAKWIEVVAEERAKDPLFDKVAESYFGFRKQYKRWGDAQSLKGTYQ
jgi:TRAP-type mannitol/chloroaromatic compound transport system substrate-binding protein